MTIGIDIVDLGDPLLQERTERTLNMIKSDGDEIIDHPLLFWLLWSAKEAVFKCKREPLNFAPSNILIKINQENESISFESDGIRGRFEITDNYIIALCGNLDEIDHHVFVKTKDDWSEGIRFMIIEFFRENGMDYHIGSDELNLPIIEPDKKEISISHHGRYGAVAYPKSLL
ncbi:4'-phosphopantetheinyl transferase superfamily protein [Ekhidna lutea]|uniref:4'-phosphopantetheinyl transferase superfamily protein n=1 Tax=Ekhidna lutea TaxID=447679 RepID=A0A239FPE7_EKHLU|nr:4'-phosphopantetheinyl transferase superfamily protein [Ekhidna lutea]SNS58787.1 4'-phosphopantetheinyl transferase superfamily protein [Ekhidna lutea]